MSDTVAMNETADDFRFWAFISYSHRDKAVAKRLQRQLETYRVPRRLVGRETPHGAVPTRVAPVFRDRDELHAGADLKASVQEALARSRWLIVVCSPDSARSEWVNREIVEFKRLHGERYVLALVARGEPFASNTVGRELEECFAPALRRALDANGEPEGQTLEPIAADMRREGDGPHRAVLKLIAGMIGVGFDELARRDLQRRVRWLSALAVASATGVVVFALMAVFALHARDEAQLQRTQAEGLIEFMLGDLRKKLEPVGRLEVLDSVGEKSLAYYAAQQTRRLDATALGHRSRAQHLIGEIRDLRGQTPEAQAAFEQAAVTTAQLLALAPRDPQRVFDHAQSVFWVGYAAWKRADGVAAEANFQEYLRLAQQLVELDASRVDWRAEVAFAQTNLGTVQLGMNRPAEALIALRAAGAELEQLAPKRPDLAFELAQNHGWRAEAHALIGEYEQALASQQRKLALFQAMPDVDKNGVAQRGIVSSLYTISLYQMAMGRLSAAEASARASLQRADVLVAQDPGNQFWRGDACAARLRLVEVEVAQKRQSEATENLQRAVDCVKAFNGAGVAGLYESTVLDARVLSLQLQLANETDVALLVRAREFLDKASAKLVEGTPDRVKLLVELADTAIALGDATQRRDSTAARIAWQRANEWLSPFSTMKDGALLTTLARAKARLGDVAGAQFLAARIQASSYRHPAYAELSQPLQAARGGGTNKESTGVKP